MAQQVRHFVCSGDANSDCAMKGHEYVVGWNDAAMNPSPDPSTTTPGSGCPFCNSTPTPS